jgi:hypothetical protein
MSHLKKDGVGYEKQVATGFIAVESDGHAVPRHRDGLG